MAAPATFRARDRRILRSRVDKPARCFKVEEVRQTKIKLREEECSPVKPEEELKACSKAVTKDRVTFPGKERRPSRVAIKTSGVKIKTVVVVRGEEVSSKIDRVTLMLAITTTLITLPITTTISLTTNDK